MPSIENYVEVALKLPDAPANQGGGTTIIIVLVPQSQIDHHREEHQVQKAVTDQLIAEALAEGRAADIWRSVTGLRVANHIEKLRFLPERPLIIEDRSADYDRDGFKGWIL